jgi:hypothetical protein
LPTAHSRNQIESRNGRKEAEPYLGGGARRALSMGWA